MVVDITRLKTGESGIVARIGGGYGLTSRVQNLGIRVGKRINKVSSHFGQGPQIIRIDNTQIALGYGMAKRIMVET